MTNTQENKKCKWCGYDLAEENKYCLPHRSSHQQNQEKELSEIARYDHDNEVWKPTENQESKTFFCRWAPSLGEFENTHQRVWGTVDYERFLSEDTRNDPTVFFGLYGLPDFYKLWRHKGKKYILWAGSDIQHFLNGYWLDEEGKMRLKAWDLAPWIDTYCTSYVENEVEKAALASVGIRSKVVPSFMGRVEDFPVSYQHSERPKLYTSVSGDDFKLYGWDKIPKLAHDNPEVEFHLYGNTKVPQEWEPELDTKELPLRLLNHPNVFIHGRVPKEQMNKEIKEMQGALRLTEFDGFSEILAKSVLMGQWPVSLIEYPHMLRLDQIRTLKYLEEPNTQGREYYQKILNAYPWNKNFHA